MPTDDVKPSHLQAFSDDHATLCGIPLRSPDALPYGLARFVTDRRQHYAEHGRTYEVCPECYANAIRRGISLTNESGVRR